MSYLMMRPTHRRRTRGMGDAASDYAAIAAQFPAGSALNALFSGCAGNPTAPQCAANAQAALATPYTTASEQAAFNASVAAGGTGIPLQTYTGAPPGTSLPVVSQPTPPGVITVTPNIQPVSIPADHYPSPTAPVATLQPAGTQAAPGTAVTAAPAPSLLSTTLLGFPIWVWGAAAVGAYFLFAGGKRGRY